MCDIFWKVSPPVLPTPNFVLSCFDIFVSLVLLVYSMYPNVPLSCGMCSVSVQDLWNYKTRGGISGFDAGKFY